MKSVIKEENIHECEYCGVRHADFGWMESHENEHKRVDELEIGTFLVYNFDSGYTR